MFFRLDDHLLRFERSFTRLRMQPPLTIAAFRDVLFELVKRSSFENAYLQMILTRGCPPIGSRDLRAAKSAFWAFCIPYVSIASPEQQEAGLHLHVSTIRRVPKTSVDPTIKHYHWLDFDMGLFEAYDAGADTVCLLDADGHIAEGPGFNLFAWIDDTLVTPEAGVLDGMTRRTVLELADELQIRAVRRALTTGEFALAQEIFLSSTAGGIIPVTMVDGRSVGSGRPGPFTGRLQDEYWRRREQGWHGTPVSREPRNRVGASKS